MGHRNSARLGLPLQVTFKSQVGKVTRVNLKLELKNYTFTYYFSQPQLLSNTASLVTESEASDLLQMFLPMELIIRFQTSRKFRGIKCKLTLP